MVICVSGYYGLTTSYPFENRVWGKPIVDSYMDDLVLFTETVMGAELTQAQKNILEMVNDNNP